MLSPGTMQLNNSTITFLRTSNTSSITLSTIRTSDINILPLQND